ncbi:MAG: hypothetical protein KGH49_01545 [Candidatus Micrarchaeota archaeon]|nr:hypothetical protein [Candidatus Micrarchaeota archaeon]
MEGSAKQKVPGGKLLTVKISYSERIESVQILGDFFLYPEDSLRYIEASITGIKTSESEAEIAKRISDAMSANGVEIIGVTAQAIAQTIRMAVKA